MRKKRNLLPIEARSFKQACKLRRDNVDTDDYWILIDAMRDTVTIGKQRAGEPSEWMHAIERKDFDKLVRWYVLGIVPRRAKATK